MAAPRGCSSIRSGLEARGAARQKPRTVRASREERAARQSRKVAAHRLPAPSPAAECPSRHRRASSSRGTGRRGNRRGGKARGRRRRGGWRGRREPRRERLIDPHRSSQTWRRSYWRQSPEPRHARQYPARAGVARASMIGQDKQGELGKCGRLASSLSRGFAKNAWRVGDRPLALGTPLERQ
jgi:hypothetical protein